MDILNRLGLNVSEKSDNTKGNRLYYAIAENYKISSIELENIQLKNVINETMKASSEDFKGVVEKVKSGLSNIWEKILEIFKAIRKFFKSIIDKIFRRKIKKDIDKSKEVINTILSGKGAVGKSVVSTRTKPSDNKTDNTTSKNPLLIEEPASYKKNMVYIYINKYFSHDNSAVRSIIENLSTVVDDYYKILMEKNDSEVGLIPGVSKYLDNNSTYNDAFIFFREPEKVKRKFSRHI